MNRAQLFPLLNRIAEALGRLAPEPPPSADLAAGEAFIWHADGAWIERIDQVSRIELPLLQGIDRVRDILLENTGVSPVDCRPTMPCCGALAAWAKAPWSKRFMPQSTRNAAARWPWLKFTARTFLPSRSSQASGGQSAPLHPVCDDLSFDGSDTSYKSLKAVLEGGIEGRPNNVVLYATSNRRHLMPRDMIENERSTAINPAEAVEEKMSLSDRFGLWLGFHACNQDTYFAMIEAYARYFGLRVPNEELRAQAIEWSVTRGARSGRVAWQFIQDLAGRLGVKLS
jgi:predicted AAA+ superfamily ATPase